jgi:sterol desaturase/sphingolipid hydroxylase (fatty acid hydroxylase superfamily)
VPAAVVALLRTLPWPEAALLLFAENLAVFVLALGAGALVAARFADRRIADPPAPVTRRERLVAASAIAVNTLITVAGLALWRAGIVRFRDDVGLGALADVGVLLVVMDLAMYVLHRVAHVRWIFPVLHRLHHEYVAPRPLTLFVLNPVEAASFGVLWLVVISVYSASWAGMTVYLALNVLFGTIGHLGVEPLPAAFTRWPFLRHLGTSTFHARHHAEPHTNFGFYTLLWDRLFGTLSPGYDADFGRARRP